MLDLNFPCKYMYVLTLSVSFLSFTLIVFVTFSFSLFSLNFLVPLLEDTPCRRVLATALRPSYKPPLLSSASHTEQVLSPAGTPSGCISSNPLCISVHPVPLSVTVEAQFVIIVDDHPKLGCCNT